MFKSIIAAVAVCALSFAVHANDTKDAHKDHPTTAEAGKTGDAPQTEKAPTAPHGKKKAHKEQPKG